MNKQIVGRVTAKRLERETVLHKVEFGEVHRFDDEARMGLVLELPLPFEADVGDYVTMTLELNTKFQNKLKARPTSVSRETNR